MKFQESALAHKYLDGLEGIEIGGSAHNPFGLNTINVDYTDSMDTPFKLEEQEICGEKLHVDVVSEGDKLPFQDKSFDFVISSHVIEHFYDPIKALLEWQRVARKYIFIICPHKERTFDAPRGVTSLQDLISRHEMTLIPSDADDRSHKSVWDTKTFLELCKYLDLNVIKYEDVDEKVGNGFTILIQIKDENV